MITNSLEWSKKRTEYQQKIKELPFNKDIRNMLVNIDGMVNALSKAEVDARRKNIDLKTLPEYIKVNEAIELLEKWIIMGNLLR